MKPVWGALVLLAAIVSTNPVSAQPSAEDLAVLQNSKIEVSYEKPTKDELLPFYERLQQRKVLEDLKAFLSPLRLTKKLTLTTKECGQTNAFYGGGTLVICYEYVAHLDKLIPREVGPADFMRPDAVAGGLVDAMLHELGHGLFDIYDVPVFGREEDAADQMSAFVMLQFSNDVARLAIKGGGYYYLVTEREFKGSAFSDEHGTDRQRFYNYLCLAYGKDPKEFQDFVDRDLLPKSRADHCGREYEQVRRAFVKTILPHIDQTMMKRVQSIRWIRPDDGK